MNTLKTLARETNVAGLSVENAKTKVASSTFKHLSSDAQNEIALLLVQMEESKRKAFLLLKPRFWTQGSFQYNTLNKPYKTPPQEMDIDDGTYLPMTIFEGEPIIGHRFLQLVVDSALQSLAAENPGWKFQSKRTCARLKIPSKNTHIDVPMYAVPEDQFREKELVLEALRSSTFDSHSDYAHSLVTNRAAYELDSSCVNLAIRDDEQKWMKSDPKVVEDWFNECCDRIGSHLRMLCRFMKAWRDAQWPEGGGPSSIALMAAIVSTLDRTLIDANDVGEAMKVISKSLPGEFESGVESPDPSDERPLFPRIVDHSEEDSLVVKKLRELAGLLGDAESAKEKTMAFEILNQAFGSRVSNPDLIVKTKSAPAFSHEPERASRAESISVSMASG